MSRDIRLLFSLRQGSCDVTGVVDEKLRDRTERAVLQGDDADRHAGHWQCDRQDLELRTRGGKPQCGSRNNRKKEPARQETGPDLGRNGDHCHARIIEPAGTKGFYCDRSDHACWRW